MPALPQRAHAASLAFLIPASLFTFAAAQARNQYFPNDGVIDQPSIGALATSVVGYANDADFSARTNGASPHIRVLARAGGTFNALDVCSPSFVDFDGGVYNSIHTYNQSSFKFTSGRVNAGFYAFVPAAIPLDAALAGAGVTPCPPRDPRRSGPDASPAPARPWRMSSAGGRSGR